MYEHGGQRHYTDSFQVELPYGEWTCRSGRRVLFNRHYAPLWSRLGDGPASAADPDEFVGDVVSTLYFYCDPGKPSRDPEVLSRCRAVLRDWGVRP